ncbi:zf-HC2 domain-containing protein, partial [Streptomyces sp. NPDC060198]|uniref:RskA family anti-sigma factor n=1 Tax=Streptomyces sp. NPDC060198 TaxID=3347070 RepID=UPI0036535707
MSTTAELHTLTGAYALHALPEDERHAFERHLAECGACAQEVAELSATASRLALAVSATPPRDMREEVLLRITTVRQEAPGHGVLGGAPARAGGGGPGDPGPPGPRPGGAPPPRGVAGGGEP